MADLKISALTASTTPLAGTEVLPIVQSSTTKQVSVANLTAGRTVNATALGVGVTTPAAGITIEARNAAAGTGIRASNSGGGYIEIACESNATSNTQLNYTNQLTAAGGNFVLSGANFVVSSGNGISFAATSHPAGMTSELLADYEEGTWTPTFATGWTTAPTVANANYTKIGNTVTVFAYLYFGVSTSAALIGGLPFTSNAACVSTGTIFESSPVPGTVGGIAVLPSSASINFNQVYAGGASFFQLSITYFV